MNKKFIILGILAVLCLVAVVAYFGQNNTPATTVSNNTSSQVAEQNESPPQDQGLEQLPQVSNPVSLPALMQKQFNGSNLKLGRVLQQTDKYTQHYITYTSGELTISGIMNVPKGQGPFPVLITNHGYIDPAIYTNGRGLRREQDYFGSRGYVVIHPDYRNHADSSKDERTENNIRLGYVEDVINAVYAVKAADLPYVDKDKIAIMGHSMGGGIAQAIMVVQPDLVDAYMLYAPVSSDAADSFHRWTTTRPEVAAEITREFGSPETNRAFWDGVSPRTYFDRVKSPVVIHHGEADRDVPLDWSVTTRDELKKQGKLVELHTYPGEGHEFGPAWPLVMQRTLEFFNSALK